MPVPGSGPQPALGMIVGEAPGRDEVKEGLPFVGECGQLLDTALKALGIEREEQYITNVVKDIPLDSEQKIRRPFQDEVDSWLPILDSEIEATAPAAILALGRTAANALTGLEGEIPFGSKVGNVYVAWHPGFILRRGGESSSKFSAYTGWLDQIRPWRDALDAARELS